MKIKILKFILVFIVFLLVLAEVLYLFGVPFFVNRAFSDGTVSEFLKNKTGMVFEAQLFNVSTYPDFSLGVKSDKAILVDKDEKVVFSADKLSGRISLLSLILKRIDVTKVSVKNLDFSCYRDKVGNFYIGNYKIDRKIDFSDMSLYRLNGEIIDSHIFYRDYKNEKNISLDLKEAKIKNYKQNKNLEVILRADLKSDEKVANFDLCFNTKLPVLKNVDRKDFLVKGFVKNFDLTPYSPYFSEFFLKEAKSVGGVFDADFDFKENVILNGQVRDFALVMKNESDSVYADGVVDVSLNGVLKKDNVELKSLLLNGRDWRFDVSGIVKNIKSKRPEQDLQVKIISSDVHSLIKMLPSVENTNHAVEKLKRYGVWGVMNGVLQLKGDFEKPLVLGKAKLENLHILNENPIVEPCSMDLEFKGDDVNLYTKVFADKKKKQYVIIEGTSELKPFGAGEIKIKSSDSVDLSTAHRMLIPIHDIVGFDLGPLPYMSISGRGNIDLLTKGTVFDGVAYGKFRFSGTNAVLKGLNTRIEDADGYLDFKGKDMLFVMEKAKIKGCPVSVKGSANLNGNIDFKIEAPSIYTNELISIVNGSELLESKKSLTEKIKKIDGRAKTHIQLKGVVKNFSDLKDVSDLDFSGNVALKDNNAKIEGLPEIRHINGKIFFDNNDINADVISDIFGGKFSVKAVVENNERAKLKVVSNDVKIDELLSYAFSQNSQMGVEKSNVPKTNAKLSIQIEYNGNPYKINFNNIKAFGRVYSPKTQQKDFLYIKSGSFFLKNDTFKMKDLNASVFDTTAKGDALVRGIFGTSPRFSGHLSILHFNVANFNKLRNMKILPRSLQKAISSYENYEGNADVRMSCVDNKVNGEVKLSNIKFLQSEYKIPITVDSGNIYINNNKISLKSINANFDNVPIFINASVDGFSQNAKIKGYFTTKVTESFVNKYINERMLYPLKPKGDITLTAEISGNSEKFRVEPKLRLEKDADIYYMGANLDDVNEEREINADIVVKKNNITINGLNYLRYMTSQNDYTYPRRIISVKGNIHHNKNKFVFDNLRIVTENNANVKLFNVLFKKSALKKGMFNCNILLNGDASAPRVLGRAGMIELDMPLYSTLIKDVSMQFTPAVVKVSMKGMSYDSDFELVTNIKNRPYLPVVIENLKISSKSVDLDNILDSLTKVTLNTGIKLDDGIEDTSRNGKKQPDISHLVIKNGAIYAEKMLVRGLPAKNFKAGIKLDRDLVLKIEDLNFEVAEGAVSGFSKYDFKTGKISAQVSAKHVDANRIATALFEAKDQIFGYLNGNMMVSTRGNTEEERINNVSGSVYFEINDGKMPKLGSVEYLLKASSLFKSGITGVSINNFIDLIAPIKTGYFNSIKGLLLISHGKAKNVEIFSSGDNLSMYIKGTYDIPESFADLNVYGRLTKKADNILGPVGNVSFNSLLNLIPGFKLDKKDKAMLVKELNKIPGVEFNDMQYRIFNAKINGNINSDKYVKYFKWIE